MPSTHMVQLDRRTAEFLTPSSCSTLLFSLLTFSIEKVASSSSVGFPECSPNFFGIYR